MTLRSMLRALLAALLLVGLPSAATTMLRLGITELSQTADTVVHGTVRRVESRWSGDRRRILTDVEIEVTEALKGKPGSTVLLIQAGGRVGDIGQIAHGSASFTQGEEVVVFLDRRGASAFQLTGMAQGKYQVRHAADTRSALAVPENTQDVLLLDPDTRQPTASTQRTLTLQELKAAIRTALQQPAQEKAQ
ncbi:hypothetical protein [Hyalangium rubrum]|uniref:Uncharacterized protein n=1 Tax=Hyalangium rubrum TaxID=3103134 RepID=A0ABU5GZC0_9BACT|nr:hypothetical protein [Hyalangium sp. s54d21]MDY7225190.1 hypothetical protein [Hyalangium sp. s54d21]